MKEHLIFKNKAFIKVCDCQEKDDEGASYGLTSYDDDNNPIDTYCTLCDKDWHELKYNPNLFPNHGISESEWNDAKEIVESNGIFGKLIFVSDQKGRVMAFEDGGVVIEEAEQ